MKEALMIIASAWSIALIVLFFASVTTGPQIAPFSIERVHIVFFSFVGAVTGCGWLWFRHELKKRGSA